MIGFVQRIVVCVSHDLGLFNRVIHERYPRAELARLKWSSGIGSDWIRKMGALEVNVQEERPVPSRLVCNPVDGLSGRYRVIELTCSKRACGSLKHKATVLVGYRCGFVAALGFVREI